MPIKNYTSVVPPAKSIAEIQRLLGSSGQARRVMTEYGDDGEVHSIAFQIVVNDRPLAFRLVPKPEAVQRIIESQTNERRYHGLEQAKRTAWRILKDYLEVALAFAELEQAPIGQLLLGFAISSAGHSYYDVLIDGERGRHLLAEHFN